MPNRIEEKLKEYFVAIVPPSPIYEEALAQKNYFKDHFNSKASLNSPPHITLHMPFRWKEQKENELAAKLKGFVQQFDPIKVCLDNYACFPPKVIFINVAKSEALDQLQKNIQKFCKKEFNLFNANYREQAFHPHLTLAFRDLKKPNFQRAWEVFKDKEYKAEFMADKIALLKHSGKIWQVFKEFDLQSSFTVDNKKSLETSEG